MTDPCLVLRLAGPLQSWGSRSEFNRRETDDRPTKSGVIGLLAAAQGRRRTDPIEDLVGLGLAVRVDQPGSLLRDYHTVSDLHGDPLLSAAVNAKGLQKPTSPKKYTHVTTRYYLQDAVFLAVVQGNRSLLRGLADAIRRPAFPLALGRRSCVPTHPILLDTKGADLWEGDLREVTTRVPWQASDEWRRRQHQRASLAATMDDPEGADAVSDVPVTFDHARRRMLSRRVSHFWVPVGAADATAQTAHDPFALLGW